MLSNVSSHKDKDPLVESCWCPFRSVPRVKGLEMPFMLDGFSGGEGKAKKIFTTPWGTFAYPRMPMLVQPEDSKFCFQGC